MSSSDSSLSSRLGTGFAMLFLVFTRKRVQNYKFFLIWQNNVSRGRETLFFIYCRFAVWFHNPLPCRYLMPNSSSPITRTSSMRNIWIWINYRRACGGTCGGACVVGNGEVRRKHGEGMEKVKIKNQEWRMKNEEWRTANGSNNSKLWIEGELLEGY